MAKGKKETISAAEILDPLVFEAEIDGKLEKYKVVYPAVIIPGLGKATAEELIQMPEVLAELIAIKSEAIQKI